VAGRHGFSSSKSEKEREQAMTLTGVVVFTVWKLKLVLSFWLV
jgi:hypothetical protein